jgi:hypothetical protein
LGTSATNLSAGTHHELLGLKIDAPRGVDGTGWVISAAAADPGRHGRRRRWCVDVGTQWHQHRRELRGRAVTTTSSSPVERRWLLRLFFDVVMQARLVAANFIKN